MAGIPETNSKFEPENGCLEYDCFLKMDDIFSENMLVSGQLIKISGPKRVT